MHGGPLQLRRRLEGWRRRSPRVHPTTGVASALTTAGAAGWAADELDRVFAKGYGVFPAYWEQFQLLGVRGTSCSPRGSGFPEDQVEWDRNLFSSLCTFQRQPAPLLPVD